MVNWKSRKTGDFLLLANAVVLVLLVNLVAARYFFRVDLTEEKRYSIKPQTKAILRALEDDVYNNHNIPKGTVIVSFYYGLHRDPKYWHAPAAFQPARFLGEAEKSTKKNFYPFGAGPRLCIGNNFAMAEMSIFLQAFLKRFDVLPGNTQPVIRPLVTLRPDRVELRIQAAG